MTKKNQNIAIFSSILPSGGGTFQWTINILQCLSDYVKKNSNIKIHFFYFNESDEYESFKVRFPDFYFYKISKIKTILMKVLSRVFIIWPFMIKILRYFYPINFICLSKCIDVVIFPGASFHPSFCRIRQVFMFTDIAHVFYPHFPEVSSNGQLKIRNLLFKYGCKYADQIVVDSNQLLKDIVKYYKADEAKIDVLYQTITQIDVHATQSKTKIDIEMSDFICKLPDNYIFYPAQLWQHKNHINLLIALSLILKKKHDVILLLSGSRKEGDDKIFSLIAELNLQDKVNYLGYVDDKYMPILYKRAQALVMPTYFGPTNIPTLEAFKYGCPAIISDLPGVTEQTGDAALLFDPDWPQDIADKIMMVLNNKYLRSEMIRKGYKRISLLSYENYRRSFFNILNKSIKKEG